MYKHKPNPKTDVKIGDKLYRCHRLTGVVELPEVYKQFNPIEEPIKKIKKVKRLDNE